MSEDVGKWTPEDILLASNFGICTVCGGPRLVKVLTINGRDVTALGCSREEYHAQDPMPTMPKAAEIPPRTGFCENGGCAVITYEIGLKDGFPQQNCPGCGQFGRIKGRDN